MEGVPQGLPWQTLGPVLAGVIIILALVFWFIIKFRKTTNRNSRASGNPRNRGDFVDQLVDIPKIIIEHQGRIASNETAIVRLVEDVKDSRKENKEEHGKIFKKLENMGEKIINAIDGGKSKG